MFLVQLFFALSSWKFQKIKSISPYAYFNLDCRAQLDISTDTNRTDLRNYLEILTHDQPNLGQCRQVTIELNWFVLLKIEGVELTNFWAPHLTFYFSAFLGGTNSMLDALLPSRRALCSQYIETLCFQKLHKTLNLSFGDFKKVVLFSRISIIVVNSRSTIHTA